MSLVSCRACDHQVDTSALACPQCGATDPGKKISRQRRDAISFSLQLIVWVIVLSIGGSYVWNTVAPWVKQTMTRTQTPSDIVPSNTAEP